MSIRYLYVTSVQEDKTMHFSNSLKWASGLQERILNIWTAWPLLYCCVFLSTTRFSVILMTGRVKITKKNPDFSQSKILLFQFNKICRVTRVKFVPSLKRMNGVWRWQSITLCQKGLTLGIRNVKELMQKMWVPFKGQKKITSVTDFIKFLCLLKMLRLIRIGKFHCQDFSAKFYVFVRGTCFIGKRDKDIRVELFTRVWPPEAWDFLIIKLHRFLHFTFKGNSLGYK